MKARRVDAGSKDPARHQKAILPGWRLLVGLLALALIAAYGAGRLFLPANSSGAFSPWERLTGETPSAKITAFVDAVSRGDEAAALALWELPKTPFPSDQTELLKQRRQEVTGDLIAAGIHPAVTIRSVEWWRTCCEPGVIDSASDAGGARMRIQLVDRHGNTLDYVVDVFNRDGAYWGAAADCPSRHWVVRDVYPANQPPLFWTWGHAASASHHVLGPAFLEPERLVDLRQLVIGGVAALA